MPVEGNPGLQSLDKKMKFAREPVSFDNDDLEGTIQPHDDALVVTAQIKWLLSKKGDDRPGERGRRDVPRSILGTRSKERGPHKAHFIFGWI